MVYGFILGIDKAECIHLLYGNSNLCFYRNINIYSWFKLEFTIYYIRIIIDTI